MEQSVYQDLYIKVYRYRQKRKKSLQKYLINLKNIIFKTNIRSYDI